MNKELEIKFINTFIINEKKERLIYELSTPKKRENALLRFSHNIKNIINEKYIKYKCNINNLAELLNISSNVYIISLIKIEGETCSYKDAISHLGEQNMPVIIIMDNYVIIKTESDDGKDNIFILEK